MNKLEHIAEVIRLYDEIDDLKRAKVGAEFANISKEFLPIFGHNLQLEK